VTQIAPRQIESENLGSKFQNRKSSALDCSAMAFGLPQMGTLIRRQLGPRIAQPALLKSKSSSVCRLDLENERPIF
jgi:hypothetical protein